jgi:hypothetical protein
VERAAFEPRPAQARAFEKVRVACAASEVGRRSGLQRARTLEDLRDLPASTYETIRDLAARVYEQGDPDGALFGGSGAVAIATTSGTTGAAKHIPISRALLASYRRSTRALGAALLHANSAWASAFAGKRLLLANSPETEIAPSGLRCGTMSGIVFTESPWLLRRTYLPRVETLKIPSWEARMIAILEACRGEDVRVIAGMPAGLKSLTEIALEHLGVDHLREAFPNLFAAFFGGTYLLEPARRYLARAWMGEHGPPLRFLENYSAVEAIVGHGFYPTWSGLVFDAYESVFQFRSPGESGDFLQLHELEPGRRYAIFLTTQGGLVNYRMNDVLEITSVAPLTFRFVGREHDEISLEGERFTPLQVERAHARVFGEHGGRQAAIDFVVWLEDTQPRRVVFGLPDVAPWVLTRAPTAAPPREDLARRLDEALQRENVTYAELRGTGFYADARVESIPATAFASYRHRHLPRGTFKEKRLFADRATFLSEFGLSSSGD